MTQRCGLSDTGTPITVEYDEVVADVAKALGTNSSPSGDSIAVRAPSTWSWRARQSCLG